MADGIPFFLSPPWGGRLRGVEWQPPPALVDHGMPLVLVLPGRGEPAEKYQETAEALCAMSCPVWVIDWRGQGLSERHPDPAISRRGHLESFETLADDLGFFLSHHRQHPTLKSRPILVLTHSMGGAVFLRWLQRSSPAERPCAAFLVAPMVTIPTWGHSPTVARLAARLAVYAGQGSTYALGQHGWGLGGDCRFADNRRTSCERRFAREVALLQGRPDLRTGGPTWRWLDQAFRLTKSLSMPWSAGYPDLPMQVAVGSNDTYASVEMHETFFRRFPAAEVLCIAGARHEVLMEQDGPRQAVLDAFRAFMAANACTVTAVSASSR